MYQELLNQLHEAVKGDNNIDPKTKDTCLELIAMLHKRLWQHDEKGGEGK